MRKEKQLLLDDIRLKIEDSAAVVIVRYDKFSANNANEFRTRMLKVQGEYSVVGKRLLRKAAQVAGVDDLAAADFDGSVGMICAKGDPLVTTKELFAFVKDRGEKMQVVGGRFDGRFYTGAQVEALSQLPDKDTMRAQLLGTFEAPMAQTLAVMEALLTSVLFCLENKASKSEGN